jgi:hypothetical protein
MVEQMGSSHEKGAEPGKEESQRKIAKDGVAEAPGTICRRSGGLCRHETARFYRETSKAYIQTRRK